MPGTRIGNNVKIQNNVSVYEGVYAGGRRVLRTELRLHQCAQPRSHVSRKDEYQPTLVRRGATIGANATVVCGVTLESTAFIGAGAVVTADVPAFGLMVGVPAGGWVGCASAGSGSRWRKGAPSARNAVPAIVKKGKS
jgi:UDP-2-acetamido-3-amino-2,3-dideoxy-glucuronate N-acetyltransferase